MAAVPDVTAPAPAAEEKDDLAELREQLYGDGKAEQAGSSGDGDDDEGQVAGSSAPAGAQAPAQADGTKVVSKNQLKKLKRMELKTAQRDQRKAAEKAEKAAKRAVDDAKRAAQPPRTAESLRLAAEARVGRDQNKADFKKRVLAGPKIVIDCDFGPQMGDKDLRHLCQQLSFSYSAALKNMDTPCHLHLLGLKGRVKEMTSTQLTGVENWSATVSELSHVEFFSDPEQRSRLVYLTADSEVEMTEVDPEKIYIIGGLVDHNSHKNICAKRAAAQGVATARLPIQKYVALETSAVLTVNQVMSILTQYVAIKDWAKVLDDVLPRRKRSDWVADADARAAAKAEAKGQPGREGGKQRSVTKAAEFTGAAAAGAPTPAAAEPAAAAAAVTDVAAAAPGAPEVSGRAEAVAAPAEAAAAAAGAADAPAAAGAGGAAAEGAAAPAEAAAEDAAGGVKRKAEGPPE